MAAELQISPGNATASDSMQTFSNFIRCDLLFHPHREPDDFLVEIIRSEPRIDHEGRAIHATAALAEQKYRGIGDLLRFEVFFTKRQFLRVKVALQVARYAGGSARLLVESTRQQFPRSVDSRGTTQSLLQLRDSLIQRNFLFDLLQHYSMSSGKIVE